MDECISAILPESVQASATGIAILDDQGVVVYANPAFAVRLGRADSQALVGTSPIPAWTRSAGEDERRALERLLRAPEAGAFTLPVAGDSATTLYLEARRSDRRIVVATTGWPQPGSVPRSVVAQLDALTGLGNRAMYDEQIRCLGNAGAGQVATAVILIDLDRFKQVNDTLGHATGDSLLVLAAKRMRSAIRGDDTLIRLGGDEFVILQYRNEQPAGARAIAERLVELLQRPFLIDGHQVNSGASVGVALLGHGTSDPADLLRHADLALYEAKRQGRSRYCFFESHLESRAFERRALELDLRRALGLRQFSLLYQPQKSFSDNTISGFEALIRWDHPARGRVSPADFIPLAEEIGEIHAIGEWVMRTACQQAASWEGDPSVAVNVSPIQFESENIVTVVRHALDASGLAPERLEIEITESTLMSNTEDVMQRLWAIKAMGVGIAMDDFGTGYASLSHLNSFPFSKLKIDKSFIQAEQSPRARALMKAILAMGSSLGMTTIAEGVETLDQYEELCRGGCTTAQGYYIAKPMTPETIEHFMRACRAASHHPNLMIQE
ncbi:diguanylate cyclase (GGDEF) domain-containing protein [Modicisalibacter ilicicola DSM 19980]|uniref:Diguanylate cyclase (GGDEF) domain-containing protein n=1 Tax=Modicisalibacter ilicicola DSM 19980 TaxID=1121942 RepID=A0A1M4W995_9GAMM|nr:EAL domain-containing protein [Halomonas ilicicola]SHE77806.1 diguanylate cyclase (GGDEF) domain-containing protein [Halomonas ilicicola DSM 19980]